MAIPSLTRVGALINPDNPYYRSMTNSLQSTARKMGTAVSLANARSLEEVGHALASMKQDHVDAVIVLDDSLFMTHRLEVAALAARYRLPAIAGNSEYAQRRPSDELWRTHPRSVPARGGLR